MNDPTMQAVREEAGAVVKDELASFCGLVLRRLQDVGAGVDDPSHDESAITVADLNKIFGEALEQYS